MRPEDAEEYTQALGQVVAGSWRQVALGKRLGVPQALGISTETWVEERLGGYIRMSIPERREAVKELMAPVEDGGQGMSTREAAEVLGVGQMTVVRDQRSEPNDSVGSPDDERRELTGEPTDSPAQDTTAVSPIPATEPEEEMLLTEGMDLSDIPSGHPPIEFKALSHIFKLSQFRQLDPEQVAAECGASLVDIKLPELERILDFVVRVNDALRSRLNRPTLTVVGKQRSQSS